MARPPAAWLYWGYRAGFSPPRDARGCCQASATRFPRYAQAMIQSFSPVWETALHDPRRGSDKRAQESNMRFRAAQIYAQAGLLSSRKLRCEFCPRRSKNAYFNLFLGLFVAFCNPTRIASFLNATGRLEPKKHFSKLKVPGDGRNSRGSLNYIVDVKEAERNGGG